MNDYFLEFSVQDSGIGISQEDQQNLFKFFGFLKDGSQTNKSGVGLGLVVAKAIVE
jgi:two-component system sensor histidine kinase EvgS